MSLGGQNDVAEVTYFAFSVGCGLYHCQIIQLLIPGVYGRMFELSMLTSMDN